MVNARVAYEPHDAPWSVALWGQNLGDKYVADNRGSGGDAKRGAAKQAALYVIDGQYVTADELAARMGIDKRRAINRFATAKAKPGPVTWAKLGVL